MKTQMDHGWKVVLFVLALMLVFVASVPAFRLSSGDGMGHEVIGESSFQNVPAGAVEAGALFVNNQLRHLTPPLDVHDLAGSAGNREGQWEASAALGMTRRQQMRHIIFPQAFRRILPPLAGQFISTIKDSAIVSVISIQELTFQGMELMAATFMTFEIWITIMVLYLILCLVCSLSVERLELFLERKTA